MKLIFTDAEFAGQMCQLGNGTTTVGRGAENRVVIQHNSVSLHHCELMVHGREVIVRDLGSANGTWVDGARVTGQHEVKNGHVVRIGSVAARVEFPEGVADEPSEVTAIHLHVAAVRQVQQPAAPIAPARTIIRPRTTVEDADGTTAVSPKPKYVKAAESERAVAEAAPAGRSRVLWFVFLALVAVTLTYIIWRAR